ncbi:MAG TPA: T9SS type A sorting domain-containing protein [Cryomorphaceae bacterium]|nr:T9SS type A sorting domain-containing protein [Cryomorphaceae bacterium]
MPLTLDLRIFLLLIISTFILSFSSKANDCLSANSITSEEDFADSQIAGSFVGAGFSGDVQCVGAGGSDDVWYSFVAVASDHGIQATGNLDLDLVIEVYDACGGAQLVCTDNAGAGLTETALLSGLTVGNSYLYRIYHSGTPATATDFTTAVAHIPFVELVSSFCGDLGYNTNELIRATNPSNTSNFTNYQFRFIEQEAPFNTYIITSPNGTNPNFLLQWFPQIEYGRTYEVSVRVRAILPTYGDFGNSCIIGLQNDVLQTSLEPEYASGFFDFCDIIGAEKVALSSQYRWRFLNLDDLTETQVIGLSDSRLLNIYRVPDLQLGTTYAVGVFATVAGQESPSGTLRFLNMNNAVPNTGLNSDIYPCGQTYSVSTFLQAREVCRAESYTWRFTNTSSAQTPIFYTRDDGSRFVDLDFVSGLIVGDSYNVEVLAEQGGLIGDYSVICNITIGASTSPLISIAPAEMTASPLTHDAPNQQGLMVTAPKWDLALSRVSNGQSTYNLTLTSEDYGQTALVEVFDLNGRKIDIVSPILAVGSTEQLNLSNLPHGIYLLRVFNGTHQETRKVTTF